MILVFLDRTHLFFEMIQNFMLNSTEHGIRHPYKCYNANNFGTLTFISMTDTESESLKARKCFYFIFLAF